MKIKILYIVSSLRKAGPIVVLQNLIRHLDKDKYEVAIVKLMGDEPLRSITKQFLDDGIKVYELNSSKKQVELFSNKIARRIDKIVEEFSPDVIHTHGYQALLCATKIRENIPIVETLHCISGEDFIMTHGKMIGSYMNYRYLKALKKISSAAAISGAVQEYFKTMVPSLSTVLIPNGVQDVPTTLPSKLELRKKLNINNDSLVFVVVGSLMERKDPITIINAFKKAFPKERNEDVNLLFIGKGVLEKDCEKIINGDNRIQLLGWQIDPYAYLKMADWSVSATHSEGFGLNFIESLIVGCPIISTNIAAFIDFDILFPELKDYKFNPGDVEELSKLMKKAAIDRIDSVKLMNRTDQYFSSRIMAQKYGAVYQRVLNTD